MLGGSREGVASCERDHTFNVPSTTIIVSMAPPSYLLSLVETGDKTDTGEEDPDLESESESRSKKRKKLEKLGKELGKLNLRTFSKGRASKSTLLSSRSSVEIQHDQ